MRESAASDRFGVHALVEDPGEADVVLFVETSTCAGPYFESVRANPIFREHRRKCYLYCATDVIVPLVPGVFPSIARKNYLAAWTRAGGYIGIRETDRLRFEPEREPSRLFSFLGSSATHRVRGEILGLSHPDALIVNTDEEPGPSATAAAPDTRYRDMLLDSAFVLCPGGGGPSTFRLMETMMMGRAPVIVSDAWCAPTGPDWDQFAVRVAERDVQRIPERLDGLRSRASEMGSNARTAWLEWFAPQAQFHRTVDWVLELDGLSEARDGWHRLLPISKAARPYHLLRWAKHRFRRPDATA
jgi:Exostosin family